MLITLNKKIKKYVTETSSDFRIESFIKYKLIKNLKIYFNKIKPAALSYIVAINAAYLYARNKQLRRFYKNNEIIKAHDFCEHFSLPKKMLFKDLEIHLPKTPGAERVNIQIPPIYMCTFSDNLVTGLSHVIFNARKTIFDDDVNFRTDILPEIHFKKILRIKNKIKLLFDIRSSKAIQEAGFFCHPCSGNYSHWMLQILPRISLFCNYTDKNIPIIVDKNIAEGSFNHSLRCVIGAKRKVIFMSKDDVFIIDKLHYISTVARIPWECKRNKLKKQVWVNPHALKVMISKIDNVFKKIKSKSNFNHNTKLYVKRVSEIRKILNFIKVEALLKNAGFRPICPGGLSFEEQYSNFHIAKEVFLQAGSEAVNCLFCSNLAKIYILIGNDPSGDFGFWRNILFPINQNLKIIVGKNLDGGHRFHNNFTAPLKKINNALHKKK